MIEKKKVPIWRICALDADEDSEIVHRLGVRIEILYSEPVKFIQGFQRITFNSGHHTKALINFTLPVTGWVHLGEAVSMF